MTTRQHRPSAAARRQALLRATVEVAAEVGAAGVTHRAVTERAGLPLATVSYFFGSIGALVEEALIARTQADAGEQIALTDALADAHATGDDVARAFASYATRRLPEALAHGLMLHELAVPGSLPPESMTNAFRARSWVFCSTTGTLNSPCNCGVSKMPTSEPRHRNQARTPLMPHRSVHPHSADVDASRGRCHAQLHSLPPDSTARRPPSRRRPWHQDVHETAATVPGKCSGQVFTDVPAPVAQLDRAHDF